MAVYTKINSKDLSNIERNFNIGKIISFSGITKGIENTNYLLKTQKGKYILTIFEKRVKTSDLPFFMNLMDGLYKLKVKCPRPIENKNKKYIFKIKKKSASIVTFLNGKDKKKLSNSNCFEVGKNIAKLHLASKKLKIYRKNSLSVNSWKPLLNKIDKRINKIQNNLIGLMNDELSIIKKNWPKHLSVGIIHSDLFIDNIFFHKNKFYGFIDFYFSANDFLSYDLATCINALCFIKKKGKFILDKNKSYNLIRGYQTVRKLSNSEKLKFNILCRGSALRYLLTRSYDYLNTPKTAIIKIKDPKEYIQKLIFHKNVNSFTEYF